MNVELNLVKQNIYFNARCNTKNDNFLNIPYYAGKVYLLIIPDMYNKIYIQEAVIIFCITISCIEVSLLHVVKQDNLIWTAKLQ